MKKAKKTLVTGGAGFVGSNLVNRLVSEGHRVSIFDNLSRSGVERNIQWLRDRHGDRFEFIREDVRDYAAIKAACKGVDVIYHLASQVAVTTSVADPRTDFEDNALGTFNALEAARQSGEDTTFVFTSTNKVYGGMEDVVTVEQNDHYAYRDCSNGISEARPLDFHSPYGCSKGAADQYVRDYHRIYGLRTIVFRMSCIYGPRQFGTEDQGWVAHFIISAVLGRPLTIYGDGKQVRDILYIDDLVRAFQLIVEKGDVCAGEIYNIGGGSANVISLLELIALLEDQSGRNVSLTFDDWRPGDQPVYISDTTKAERDFGWEPTISKEAGVQKLYEWVVANRELFLGG